MNQRRNKVKQDQEMQHDVVRKTSYLVMNSALFILIIAVLISLAI